MIVTKKMDEVMKQQKQLTFRCEQDGKRYRAVSFLQTPPDGKARPLVTFEEIIEPKLEVGDWFTVNYLIEGATFPALVNRIVELARREHSLNAPTDPDMTQTSRWSTPAEILEIVRKEIDG